MDRTSAQFENLVISYKCKTQKFPYQYPIGFENLVISYKCKTVDNAEEYGGGFENLVISYKCKTTFIKYTLNL